MDEPKDGEKPSGDSSEFTNKPVPTVEQTPVVSTSLEAPEPDNIPPVAPPPAPVPAPQNHAITLVLQWLTYAFWGWFALAMVWISAITFGYFVVGSSSQDWTSIIAYPIAATIVLFLVAATIDFFYARIEPVRKEGFATAIMVIHAVVFALCGIAAVISLVFTVISLSLNGGTATSGGKASLVVLYTSLVMIVVYALLIARATLVAKIRRLPLIATGVLGVMALGFIITSIVGPVAQSNVTKQDREIETTLPVVVTQISDYTNTNGKLPASLDQLHFASTGYDGSTNPQQVVDKGLIEYTPNVKPSDDGSKGYQLYAGTSNTTVFFYRLCTTYTAASQTGSTYRSSNSGASMNSYQSYISTTSHEKGKQCYNLSTDAYRYTTTN